VPPVLQVPAGQGCIVLAKLLGDLGQ
jgi:hypothetical protein